MPDPERRFARGGARAGGVAAAARPAVRVAATARGGSTSRARTSTGMEYLLGDRRRASCPTRRTRCARAGPFGDKSVIEWPEYEPPAWLDSIADAGPGRARSSSAAAASSRACTCCSTRRPSRPAPTRRCSSCTTAPSTREYAGLTRFLDAMSWEERIPPLRAALIQPVDRNETYSASALYAGALARELLPRDREARAARRRIGMGASLGALAMLHAHRRHPKRFDGLLLQSGSFFRQRSDKQESHVPALPADHALRRHGAPRRRRRATDPGRDHLRHGRGEPREQRGGRRRARRAGLPGLARRGARRAQLDVLARRVRPAPARADRGGRDEPARRSRSTAARCSRTATTAGRWSRSRRRTARRTTGRTAAWSTRSATLLDGGRVKLYCVPSFDRESWTRGDLPLEERARRHGHYEWWVLTRLVPFVQADSHTHELIATGCVVRRLPRGELLPQARRPLPARDLHERRLRRRRCRVAASAATPSTSTTRWTTSRTSHGDHLDWLRRAGLARCSSAARGSGRTRPARSTRRSASARCSPRRAFRHEVDLWGHDVPHDWPSWRRQIAHHLPRFCLMTEHAIGLLLGTEEDWPAAFEALVARLGPVDGHDAAHRADPQRAVRPALPAALLARDRPARVVVRPAARLAEEGLADGRRLSAEQPVHVPGDGEALGVLRADAARHPRAGDVADPAQGAAGEPALPADRRAVQRAVRPRGDRRATSATRSS